MDDLVEWLRAQLDEDERVARWAKQQREEDGSDWWWDQPEPTSGAEHLISRFSPARVLREVEAKRRILDDWQGCADKNSSEAIAERAALWHVIKVHAAALSDRPGYREEWRR